MRALLLAGMLVIARDAFADGAGVISNSPAVATAMTDAMTGRAPRIIGDAVGRARAQLGAGAVPVDALARFKRVRELVDDGWRAYLRVAIELAGQRLGVARTEAEPLVALPGGAEVYADAALRLGAVLDKLGRKPESQAVLALALALDPERPITVAEFSPDVIEAVDAVRALPPVMQRLEITTVPAGATVRVDSNDVGRSPVTLDVPRGQHVVVARLPGHRAAVQGVAVDASRAVALELEPDAEAQQLAAGVQLGLDAAAQQRLLDAAMRYADLDEIVVVAETSRHGGPTLLVQRCAGVPARCSAVVEIGLPDRAGLATAAKSAWDAVRGGELRYPPTALGERGDGVIGTPRCRICRSPYLWGGVGAAIVAGAVVTLIVTSGDKPVPVVGADPDKFHRP